MAIGFPPSYIKRVNLNVGCDDLAAIVVDTLNDLGWKYISEKPCTFNARVSLIPSMRGGGWESFKVEIDQYGGVEISSRSLFPIPFFDFGKNRENVEAFVEKLCLKSFDVVPRFSSEKPFGGRSSSSIVGGTDGNQIVGDCRKSSD